MSFVGISCGRAWGAPPGKAGAQTQTGNRMQRYKTMQAKANMQVIFFTATTINHNQPDVTATRRQRTATASRLPSIRINRPLNYSLDRGKGAPKQ